MSWQRIFELARRQKSPLIVTDIAGREPIVVIPLEAYERLVEAPAAEEPVIVPVRAAAPEPTYVMPPENRPTRSVSRTPPMPQPAPVAKQQVKEATLEEIIEPIPEPRNSMGGLSSGAEKSSEVPEEQAADDLLLEEKFYLEPVDEDGK